MLKLQLVAIGLTNENSNTLKQYLAKIKEIICSLNKEHITILILPEYCWGSISSIEFENSLSNIQALLGDNDYIVYGTYPWKKNGERYNMAFFGNNSGIIQEIPKTRVLEGEIKRNQVVSGINPGVINVKDLKIAVIICADIWDNILLNKIIKDQQADILLIPSFTVVPKGHSDYAKMQWYSLAIVRSREYLVPIAIADHMENKNNSNYSTGKSTLIVDPSLKHEKMRLYEDFLELPKNNVSILEIELDEIQRYQQYRINKGLYQKKSSKES